VPQDAHRLPQAALGFGPAAVGRVAKRFCSRYLAGPDGGPSRGSDESGGAMTTHRRIDVSRVGDVSIVKFLDKKILDEAGIQELGLELFALVEHDKRKAILLNFSDVEFLSSAALGKLITLDRKVKAAKGRMKMCHIRPEILEVFQITKLNKVFDIRGDEAEAIAAFS
jgi:anti-sigma B factor antagonist